MNIMTKIFFIWRRGWRWKDLSRFICLKIWPRLPNQSKRAIQELNNADSNDHTVTKDLVRSTVDGLIPNYNSSNALPVEKRINGLTTYA